MGVGAERVRDVQLSQIRAIMDKARELAGQGKQIINLGIGEPDFDTPEHIVTAAQQALAEGQTHYGPNRGLLSLRQAIAAKLAKDNGIVADPNQEIVVTVGAAEALFVGIMGHMNPGEEVIVVEPAFGNYVQIVRMAGAIPVTVSAREENSWIVDPTDVEKAITPRTRMLVINSPNNPTGAVLPRSVLEELGNIAVRHDLLILSDEIYEKIIYGDNEHVSVASLPGLAERTLTINGYSKAYAMTGWRLAYIVAQADLMLPILKVHQYTTTCATTFAQTGAIAATTGPQDCVKQMVSEFDRRRQLVIAGLKGVTGISCVPPQGAFYAFFNMKSLGLTPMQFVEMALHEAGVAMVPGTAFGESGKGYVRLSYANSYENIGAAIKRLQEVLPHRTKSIE